MLENDRPNDLQDVRPTSFSHIVGQRHVTEALRIAVDASFQERKRLDETLLCGPTGFGKSALVAVLPKETAVPFTEILAQSVTNAAELNSILLSASEGILFLDEIHLLSKVVQHSLLLVLDKRSIFVSSGKTVHLIPVSDFTLVGATTDPDDLIQPLLDRFKIILHLDTTARRNSLKSFVSVAGDLAGITNPSYLGRLPGEPERCPVLRFVYFLAFAVSLSRRAPTRSRFDTSHGAVKSSG